MTVIITEDYLKLVGNSGADIVLANTAYFLTDISPLLSSAKARGSDRKIPGVHGVLPYPRRRTVTEYSLDLFVDGAFNDNGGETVDPRQSVYDHMDLLNDELVQPPSAANGTRLGTIVEPAGTTRRASVHVVEITVNSYAGPSALNCSLVISLPYGRFEATGS